MTTDDLIEAQHSVIARFLDGWYPRDVIPPDGRGLDTVWVRRWGPGARDQEPELVSNAEAAIIRAHRNPE